MKILVTGHTGFIGSELIKQLTDDTVILYDGRFEPTKENLFEKYGRPDALIHLAWSGLPDYKSIDHFNNVIPQFEFIENLVNNGLKSVTVTGTCLEGIENQVHYALAKTSLRQRIEKLKGINLKWLRLFTVTSENRNNSLFYNLKIAKDELNIVDVKRDFISVENTVKHIIACAKQKEVTGIIDIGHGEAASVVDLCRLFRSDIKYNIVPSLNDYEPYSFHADITKLKKIYENR